MNFGPVLIRIHVDSSNRLWRWSSHNLGGESLSPSIHLPGQSGKAVEAIRQASKNEIRIVAKADFLHDALRGDIGGQRPACDLREPTLLESDVEAGHGDLGGQSPVPAIKNYGIRQAYHVIPIDWYRCKPPRPMNRPSSFERKIQSPNPCSAQWASFWRSPSLVTSTGRS